MSIDLQKSTEELLTSYTEKNGGILHVLVTVSGGPDSMALLDACNNLAEADRLLVTAAYLNHHPGSDNAESRANLVREYCGTKGIPFIIDVIGRKTESNQSPEEWMRQERYDYFRRTASENHCDYILTGHHANDQAETVLHRVITGTGLRGLQGIRDRRDNILRPLLNFRKHELIEYCTVNKLPFLNDPHNDDLDRPRNRIRHEIIPSIEATLNPEVQSALCRLSRWVIEADAIISKEVADCYKASCLNFQKGKIVLDLNVILAYFTMIQKYAIQQAISTVSGTNLCLSSIDFDRIVDFLRDSRTGAYLSFADNVIILRDRDRIIIQAGTPSDYCFQLAAGVNQRLDSLLMDTVWEKPTLHDLFSGDGFIADFCLCSGQGTLTLR